MATYKVPQDVEAEDKLLGPLTFKQFIFFLIAAGAGLVAWLMFKIHPLLVLVPLPIVLIFGGLAVFRREDQPMERYLLSFFNYILRPRQRIWDPEGYYEHVVITREKKQAPTPIKQDLEQVHGQLEKLAQTVDTRGWATKRPELTVPDAHTSIKSDGDDRLFMPDSPQEPSEVHEREDIMSEENPEGMQLDNLLHEQTRQRREEIMQNVQQQARAANAQQQTADSQQDTSQQSQNTPNQTQASTDASSQPEPAPLATNSDSSSYADQPIEDTQTNQSQSDILDVSGELSVSQIAAVANRKSDDTVQEGEEIQLR